MNNLVIQKLDVKDIFDSYAERLEEVDKELLAIFKSNVFLIPMIGRHILDSGGKRIRPLFLLLSADLCGYKGASQALLAAIIEAIHTASLLHDDVIDGAETRRGRPAANALWGNQIVILVGDFLYSNALKLAVNQKNQKIMEALSEATTRMTEGEILQLNKTGDPDITKEEYFEIIAAKTGVLISSACKIGGILAGVAEDRQKALADFGMKTGMAFQMADDVLDYVAKQDELGKKLGKDLGEGKITMPLIYLLETATYTEREEVKGIIKRSQDSEGKGLGLALKRILDLFSKYKAIKESLKIARKLVEEAKSELDVFPASREKEALLSMAGYAMQREK
ncbi:MAG: polyprenyl synthetase family protein [Thermodesulfovibrionales bacterium]|nr:polyprenyl synthetase family protein [Thermodesulfovibrionales bacterium]